MEKLNCLLIGPISSHLFQFSLTTIKMFKTKNVADKIKDLVKKIAYMFYEGDKIMIVEALLKETELVTADILSEKTNMPQKELTLVLGRLKADGLINSEDIFNSDALPKDKKITETDRKNNTKRYYYIDYKRFPDAVRLKFHKCLELLKSECGKEDDILYKCPKCSRIMKLQEAIPYQTGSELVCPSCPESLLEKLDLSADENIKKKQREEFIKIMSPIQKELEILNDNVIINHYNKRRNPLKIISEKEYKRKFDKRKKELEDKKKNRPVTLMGDQANVVVEIKEEQLQFYFKYSQKKPMKEDPEIDINGKAYTFSQLTPDFLLNLARENFPEYEKVASFIEINKQ